jgi:hypothetical protein
MKRLIDDIRRDSFITICFVALILLLVLLFSSCYSERKAKSQFSKAVVAYPQIPLDYCANQFPDKPDSVIVYETKTDTLWELIQFYDTTSTNDTVIITDHKTKVVTKTIWRDSIIYRENKADQERINLMLIDCQRNNNVMVSKLDEKDLLIAEWKGKAKKRWLWIALLIGGAAAYTGFKLYSKFKT